MKRLLPLFLAFLVLPACSGTRTQSLRRESVARAPRAARENVERRCEQIRPAVVRIRSWLGEKHGVIVRADGIVLTCGHGSGLRDDREEIRFADGRIGEAQVLGADEESDLLALRITTPPGPFPALALAPEVRAGDWAFLVTPVPGAGTVGLAAGEVFMVDMAGAFGPDDEYRNPALLIEAPAVPGESGAPIVNDQGEVIGIASMAGITEKIALLIGASANHARAILPRLVRGEWIPSETGAPERMGAFFDGLRRNPRALWAGGGEPPARFLADYRALVDRLEREHRVRWKDQDRFTADMTGDGLKAVLDGAQELLSGTPP